MTTKELKQHQKQELKNHKKELELKKETQKNNLKKTAKIFQNHERKKNFIHIWSTVILGIVLLAFTGFLIYAQIFKIAHPVYFYIAFLSLALGFAGLAKMDMLFLILNKLTDKIVNVIVKKLSDNKTKIIEPIEILKKDDSKSKEKITEELIVNEIKTETQPQEKKLWE